MQALHTAATGMAAQELSVQVISNNIANLQTTGYKKQTAAFQDLIYEHIRRVGAQASRPGHHPAGRHRYRRRRQDRRHAALDDAGHAVADRQRSRSRHHRRRLLQDPDAGRHLPVYPRRHVPDGQHRAASSTRRAIRCSRPSRSRRTPRASTVNAQGQVSVTLPGVDDDLDHHRPDRSDALHQQGRPAAGRQQPLHRHAVLRPAAGRPRQRRRLRQHHAGQPRDRPTSTSSRKCPT